MWWNKLDFDANPFSSSPGDFEPFGLEKVIDELAYRVEAGSIVFIEGIKGTGKTAILFSLISRFKGKGKVIYFDCSTIEKDVNIQNLMKERYGFFGKLFNIIPKDMILLLDNVQLLSKKNSERVKHYFDNNYLRTAVFTGESYKKAKLPKGLTERIGSRIIALKPLKEDEVVEAMKARIGSKIMDSTIIKKIYKLSGKNLAKTIENCNALCEKYIENSEDSITDNSLKEYFGGKYGTMV